MTEQERNDMIREYYLRQLEQNGGCAGPMLTLVLLVVLLLVGCRTTESITVPEVHTEYVYRDSRDSIYVRDSIYIKEQQKGDTVTVLEYRYRDRFRYLTDTLVVRDTVTVYVPHDVVKVFHSLTWWQKILCWAGGLALWAGGFLIFVRLTGKK